jgi:hypothetical protein
MHVLSNYDKHDLMQPMSHPFQQLLPPPWLGIVVRQSQLQKPTACGRATGCKPTKTAAKESNGDVGDEYRCQRPAPTLTGPKSRPLASVRGCVGNSGTISAAITVNTNSAPPHGPSAAIWSCEGKWQGTGQAGQYRV